MLKEFQEFALKGNVVDLAVGVIIGAAFDFSLSGTIGSRTVSEILPSTDNAYLAGAGLVSMKRS